MQLAFAIVNDGITGRSGKKIKILYISSRAYSHKLENDDEEITFKGLGIGINYKF
jgi:hypothetical protein